jgi:predicted signal transduction protein with EAL and GGDEF domain
VVDDMRAEGWAVSASIGVVTFATPPDDVQAALKLADHAMYQVKRSGKGRVRIVEIQPTSALRAVSSNQARVRVAGYYGPTPVSRNKRVTARWGDTSGSAGRVARVGTPSLPDRSAR